MSIFQKIWHRLRSLAQRGAVKLEIDEELCFHIEQHTAENIAAGMSAEEAEREARKRFGNLQSVREECRERRGASFGEATWQDVRFGLRMLRKNPGFTTVAVLTLALGIGACTAIFSVVDGVLLRPLAYPQSERLVVVKETRLPQIPEFSVAPANYMDWRAQASSFEQLAAVRRENYNLTGGDEPIRVLAERVTPNYLTTFRTRPALGRDFSEEEAAGKASVVLLTQGFWLRRFGGRADALGETIHLNSQVFTIIGVLGENFRPGNIAEIYTLAAYDEDNQNRGGKNLFVVGRLKPGITIEQARTELTLIATRLAKQYPDSNTGWSVKLTPLLEFAVADLRPVLYSLLGAVGFLLLIACANVANLLLARATSRAKEISVRTALGASRVRIIRQLLSESVLLATFGGVLGVFVAQWGMTALLALAPADLPRIEEIALDGRALGFTCVIALLTGIGFGLVPAFQASRVSLNETLKEGNRGNTEGGHRQRWRGSLVVLEVATALVLLVGAGLLIRSFTRLQNVNPGFQPQDAMAASVSLPKAKYGQPPQQVAFVEQAVARLAAIPGVVSAGATLVLPFSNDDFQLYLQIPGGPALRPGEMRTTLFYSVTPDYFKAMGIPLLRGRPFTAADGAGAPRVALINEAMVKRYFPGADPIGKRISLNNTEAEIIGIVADVKHYALNRDDQPQTYQPFAQSPFDYMTFVLRTSGPVSGLPAAIRAAIYDIDKDQPIAGTQPLGELLAASVARQRFAMFLFATFSGVALLLSAIGIYGVMAYSVTQRTNEIGLRMALGAQRADILRLVFRQGGQLIALGLAAGLIGALVLTRFLAAMLFGVSAYDPLTFIAIAVLLTAVAAIACWLPARRAARVDPMEALRHE